MLSIGKLSHLAQMQEQDPHSIDEHVLDGMCNISLEWAEYIYRSAAFHDGLDFVSVHENLLEDLRTALANIRAKQSVDAQVDTITKTKASRLGERRALQNVSYFDYVFCATDLGAVAVVQTTHAQDAPGQGVVYRGRCRCPQSQGQRYQPRGLRHCSASRISC